MALTKFTRETNPLKKVKANSAHKRLNASMTPRAVNLYNKYARRIIDVIDEAAVAASDLLDADEYSSFIDELLGLLDTMQNNYIEK